jgi:hypothetical protein
MQFTKMKYPTGKPRGSGGSVQLEIERYECSNFSGKNSFENSNLKLPINHNKKRVSIMLDEDMLRNRYPSLLILGNDYNFEKPVKSSLKKYLGDTNAK